MKIFISWSGKRSRAVAEALSNWLQRVIQAAEPFYTPQMEKGVKWSNEIDDALEGTRFAIVCLTPDNLNSTWIHYETGALSKTKDAVIWTFLHGLTAGDVPQPLGKFQHTLAEKADVLKLLHSINARLREVGTGAIKDGLLDEIFEETWSKLEIRLKEAEKLSDKTDKNSGDKTDKVREEKDVLNEILEMVRNQQRQLNTIEKRWERESSQTLGKRLSKVEDKSNLQSVHQQIIEESPGLKEIIVYFTSKDSRLDAEKAFKILLQLYGGNISHKSITADDEGHNLHIKLKRAVTIEFVLSVIEAVKDSGIKVASWIPVV